MNLTANFYKNQMLCLGFATKKNSLPDLGRIELVAVSKLSR